MVEKNSYERGTYESVDDGSPSWVTFQKWTENKMQALKGTDPFWGHDFLFMDRF